MAQLKWKILDQSMVMKKTMTCARRGGLNEENELRERERDKRNL